MKLLGYARRSRIAVTIGFAIVLAAPTGSHAAEIRVLTTRAMNHVLTEVAGTFQGSSEHKFTLILAPPAEIRRRIANDEVVDVAISGSGIIGELVQQGQDRAGQPTDGRSRRCRRSCSRGSGEA